MKVSIEQLIKRKLDKDSKKNATKNIFVKGLGGELTFNNPSDSMRIEYLEKTRTGSYVDMVEAMVKIIYDCCPTLQSKELQQEIGVDYPYDTVKAIFEIPEITDLGIKLINFDEAEEENEENSVKN